MKKILVAPYFNALGKIEPSFGVGLEATEEMLSLLGKARGTFRGLDGKGIEIEELVQRVPVMGFEADLPAINGVSDPEVPYWERGWVIADTADLKRAHEDSGRWHLVTRMDGFLGSVRFPV